MLFVERLGHIFPFFGLLVLATPPESSGVILALENLNGMQIQNMCIYISHSTKGLKHVHLFIPFTQRE